MHSLSDPTSINFAEANPLSFIIFSLMYIVFLCRTQMVTNQITLSVKNVFNQIGKSTVFFHDCQLHKFEYSHTHAPTEA